MNRFIWGIIVGIAIGAIVAPAIALILNYSAGPDWRDTVNQIGWASLQVSTIAALFMLVALVTPYVFGYMRRPKLDITVGPTTGQGRPWRFLHLTVFNRPNRGLLRFVVRKDSAPSCKVRLAFMPLDPNKKSYVTKPLFSAIEARWSAQPEPLRPAVVNGELKLLAEPSMVVVGQSYNLPPGNEGSDVAVVVKYQQEKEAYAFNSYSYYYPKWQNPDWKILQGEYLVRATVISGEDSCVKDFRLTNLGDAFDNFGLRPMVRLKKSKSSAPKAAQQ